MMTLNLEESALCIAKIQICICFNVKKIMCNVFINNLVHKAVDSMLEWPMDM